MQSLPEYSEKSATWPINDFGMQMKMFLHRDPEVAEQALNDWLEKTAVKLHHVVQSQSENQGKFVLIVSVFYERIRQTNTFKLSDRKNTVI